MKPKPEQQTNETKLKCKRNFQV